MVHVVDWDNTGLERTLAMQQGCMLTFCGLRIGNVRGTWTHPEFAVRGAESWDWFRPATCEACRAALATRALQFCSASCSAS